MDLLQGHLTFSAPLRSKVRLTWRTGSAVGVWRTLPRITSSTGDAGSPIGRLHRWQRRRFAPGGGSRITGGPAQVTQAVIGHIIPAADGLVDGGAGGADAAAAPLSRLVGDAFRAWAAGQSPTGVVGPAFARMEHQQLQIQATGVLEVYIAFQ
jgi:hypothetical protein